jgi:hypothetical protein
VALALALAGCSGASLFSSKTPPPPDPNLYPSKYRQEVTDFLRTYLNNPTKVKDAYISEPTLKPTAAGASRYVSCVRYNARDTANKYQGNEEKMAIFFSGAVNQFLSAERDACAGANYQRFPEAESMVP